MTVLREQHPDVVLHLRDFLVPAGGGSSSATSLIAYAKVPARSVTGRLVVTAASQRSSRGRLEWAVHAAAFGREGRQIRTPRQEAEAWARAIFGDPLDVFVRRTADGQQWPWPEQLTLPAEKFVIRHDVQTPCRHPSS